MLYTTTHRMHTVGDTRPFIPPKLHTTQHTVVTLSPYCHILAKAAPAWPPTPPVQNQRGSPSGLGLPGAAPPRMRHYAWAAAAAPWHAQSPGRAGPGRCPLQRLMEQAAQSRVAGGRSGQQLDYSAVCAQPACGTSEQRLKQPSCRSMFSLGTRPIPHTLVAG